MHLQWRNDNGEQVSIDANIGPVKGVPRFAPCKLYVRHSLKFFFKIHGT